jgi:hypothetical protein
MTNQLSRASRYITLFLFTLAASPNCYAAWSGTGSLSNLRIWQGRTVLGQLSSMSGDDSQAACGSTANARQFGFSLSQQNAGALLSMLLSVDASNTKIKIYMTGNCVENRPEINGVWITD